MNFWKALLYTFILIILMNLIGFMISSISYFLKIPYIISFITQSILTVFCYYFGTKVIKKNELVRLQSLGFLVYFGFNAFRVKFVRQQLLGG